MGNLRATYTNFKVIFIWMVIESVDVEEPALKESIEKR